MDGLQVAIGREGQRVRADYFVAIVGFVLESLAATERHALPSNERTSLWNIVRLHNSVPTLELAPDRTTDVAETAVVRVIRRFSAWEVGEPEESSLAPDELDSYTKLAKRGSQVSVRLTYRKSSVVLTERSRSALEQLAERRLRDITTVEGRLEYLNVHGRFRAGIYDAWTGHRIPCEFAEALWPEVAKHLRQHVVAEGEATYHHGAIVHFTMWSLHAVPDTSHLCVDPRDWVGLGCGQYDGLPGDEYIRRLWEQPDEH